jgi:hypothetical protein
MGLTATSQVKFLPTELKPLIEPMSLPIILRKLIRNFTIADLATINRRHDGTQPLGPPTFWLMLI